MSQSTKSVDPEWHLPSSFLAIYVRWEMVDFQAFVSLEDSLAYLDRNREYGDLYPLCVYDSATGKITFRYHWPNGIEMTDQDLQPYIEYIKPFTVSQSAFQQIKDAAKD